MLCEGGSLPDWVISTILLFMLFIQCFLWYDIYALY